MNSTKDTSKGRGTPVSASLQPRAVCPYLRPRQADRAGRRDGDGRSRLRHSETLLRLGVAGELLNATLLIFAVLALYRLFKGVNERLCFWRWPPCSSSLFLLISFLNGAPQQFRCSDPRHWCRLGAVRHFQGASEMPWRCCSSVCIRQGDLWSRKSSGGCGYSRTDSSSFDLDSFPVYWASY